ncbi:acetyltransferase [Novosphingobium sp. 9]|uniref:acetyltransferase n=1 Tax=Novosphingobium sp. 9 TaxID=2025349 RepID=UPI0021B5D801|nr:acetyltransferase [Novosphingobium sp. 9]
MALVIVSSASGQHASVVYEAALLSGMMVQGYASLALHGPVALLHCPYLGSLDDLIDGQSASSFVIACGDNSVRESVSRRLEEAGSQAATVCHPAAILSPSAIVGSGAMFLAGAILGPRAAIGDGTIVNHAASVDHDCVVGPFANLCPGARLGGAVHVGEGAFIGINASVLPGLRLGAGCVIGAGAVVTQDVPEGATVVGVPARQIGR